MCFVEKHKVKLSDVDCYGNATVENMINYLAETGFNQLDQMGKTPEVMISLKEAWVVSKTYMEVYRYPVWKDYIQVETWISSINSRNAIRECRYFSEQQELLASARFLCTLVDIEKGVSKVVSDEEQAIWDINPQKANDHIFGDFNMNGLIPHWQRSLEINFQHIDLNRHVNNVHYLSWFLSSLPAEIHRKNQVFSFEIIYRRELKLGDTATISIAQANLIDGKQIFIGQIHNNLSQCAALVRASLTARSR